MATTTVQDGIKAIVVAEQNAEKATNEQVLCMQKRLGEGAILLFQRIQSGIALFLNGSGDISELSLLLSHCGIAHEERRINLEVD